MKYANEIIEQNRCRILLSIPVLALALSGCMVTAVESESPVGVLIEEQGSVWLSARAVQNYRCEDGLLLVCDTPQNRLSDRLCRCVR